MRTPTHALFLSLLLTATCCAQRVECCANTILENATMPASSLKSPKDIQNLVIVVAMDVEEKAISSKLSGENEVISSRMGVHARRSKLGSHTVWVLKSGVGGVNAAVGLALLMDKHPVDAVISLGVGGAIAPDLQPGDVVISKNVLQHDSVLTGDAGVELMAPGHLFLSLAPADRPAPRLASHAVLTEWLKEIFTKSPQGGERVFTGTILSGAEFAASVPRKLELARRDSESLLVEMEAAGLAQICARSGVPFVAAKTVADRLNVEGDTSTEYVNFLPAASEHAGRLAEALVKTFE